MGRALLVLQGPADRKKAALWVEKAPAGTRLTFQASKRSIPQNSLLWSLLGDVAEQIPYHGMKLKPDDFKHLFLDALKREMRIVPNLNGDGFCNLGRSSSDLSKSEMTELIELIIAWGTQKGVIFKLLPPIER